MIFLDRSYVKLWHSLWEFQLSFCMKNIAFKNGASYEVCKKFPSFRSKIAPFLHVLFHPESTAFKIFFVSLENATTRLHHNALGALHRRFAIKFRVWKSILLQKVVLLHTCFSETQVCKSDLINIFREILL